MTNINYLKQIWNFYGLGNNDVFNDIIERYNEKHRYYHDVDHIISMFQQFDIIVHQLYSPKNVAAAIFCHDVIYNTFSTKNEENSADYVDNLDNKINKNEVKEFILATKSHLPRTNNNDELYFLDIDLSVLGMDYSICYQYDANIRKEFSWVDNETFINKRGDILREILGEGPIFRTNYFYENFENKARQNISFLLYYYY